MDQNVQAALEFIKESLEKYERVAAVSSWGKDSLVLLHLVLQVKPDIPVIFVNTPFKPKQTLQLRDDVVREWKINLVEVESEHAKDEEFMKEMVLKDPPLYVVNPDECCRIFKVEPIRKMAQKMNLDAWFSGLRATESEKRAVFPKVHKQGGFVRLHPLLDWTEADVWRYTATHNLPTHPFYKEGYRSIGCAPCSSPGGKHERDGRWKGTTKQGGGCGIHDTCLTW